MILLGETFMIYLDSSVLSSTMASVLSKKGVASESIGHVVSSLVSTSLRGVDSHGVNLFSHYCHAVDAGRINKVPRMGILDTGTTTAALDADHAFGHHAGAVAIDKAIESALMNG